MKGNGAKEAADLREAPILAALAKSPLLIEQIAALLGGVTNNAASNFMLRSKLLGRAESVRFGMRCLWCLPEQEPALRLQAREERKERMRVRARKKRARENGRGQAWALRPYFRHVIVPASSVPPPVSGPSSVFAWADGFAL
jgi:hypothetical protein